MEIENINKHLIHKKSPEKVRIEGDKVITSQYCYDCDEEFDIETKENKWILDHDITCPSCGMKAFMSTKYFQDGNRVRKKRFTHCFSCDYTIETYED